MQASRRPYSKTEADASIGYERPRACMPPTLSGTFPLVTRPPRSIIKKLYLAHFVGLGLAVIGLILSIVHETLCPVPSRPAVPSRRREPGNSTTKSRYLDMQKFVDPNIILKTLIFLIFKLAKSSVRLRLPTCHFPGYFVFSKYSLPISKSQLTRLVINDN